MATVAGRATTTWTDTTPPTGTSWYKLTAYRYGWLSAETAESLGADPAAAPVLSGTRTGTTVPASWTAVPGTTSYTLNRVATTTVGPGMFANPEGVAADASDILYVADTGNNKITAGGVSGTVAGWFVPDFLDGNGIGSRFASPAGVSLGPADSIYIADLGNNRIRKVTQMADVTTVAGTATYGFADSAGVVSSAVYTGLGLSYSNTGLVVGTSYTYTVTAVGPGTVEHHRRVRAISAHPDSHHTVRSDVGPTRVGTTGPSSADYRTRTARATPLVLLEPFS